MSANRKRRGGRYTPPKPRPIKLTEFTCESCGDIAYLIHPYGTCTGAGCDCDERSGYRRICDDCWAVPT
jgi:hypothetical protein